MTLIIDRSIYSNLLLATAPKVIESDSEYKNTLTAAEELTFKKDKTPEEIALYRLLVTLVEAYETEHYPIESPSPDEILRHILEASGTSVSALIGILGTEQVVSEIVNGHHKINPVQAQMLGEMFQVSSSLFI